MEDFVADSEEEAQLRLSASISPRRALESAFSRDITNDTGIAQPTKSFAASVISQFTSTITSSGQRIDESPIIQFSTAETRVSTSKIKKPSQIIDISDDDGSFSHVASSSRQPRPDSAAIEPKKRKNKPKETKAARSRREASRDSQPPSTDEVLAFDEPLERVSITDESDLQETRIEKDKKKKPTKPRKKSNKNIVPETIDVSSVASEQQDSPPPSKKRKAADGPSLASSKPAKKRKRTPPQEGRMDQQEKPKKVKASRTSQAKQPMPTDDGADSAPDELLLASDRENKTSKSGKAALKPPSNTSMAPSLKEPSPPRSESPDVEHPPPVAQLPPTVAPPATLTPRPSLVQQKAHQIPKRGSISNLLRKTGAYAPLSSSKLTRTVATKIAPLHADRKTPPPPPAPIPKPKKKVVEEEDEEDFTGMTEKQIEKYKEEKRKKAWYSP